MSRTLRLTQCPVFVESGDVKITTEYGDNIPDYPTPGRTGSHHALDIVRTTDGQNSKTATICAIADGVIYAQRKWVKGFNTEYSAGNCVYIRHSNGMITKYYHLKYGTVPEWVADNVPVKKGQTLGFMGATGLAYGAHLHFQVEDPTGKTVDPEPYLTGQIIIPSGDEKRDSIVYITERDLSDAEKAEIKERCGVNDILFVKEV